MVLCFSCILWVSKPCCFKGFVLQKIRSNRNWPHNRTLRSKINKYSIYIQEMDKIMENIRHCWNKTVCVGCTERTLVLSIFHYSFVCLCCIVLVSVHYILCLVAVCMKILQNGRLVRFSKRTYC